MVRHKRQSEGYIKGFRAAEKEFLQKEDPDFTNPYKEGTDEYAGWEDAKYIFTQK